MHEIAKHTGIDIKQTYKERYMPTYDELEKRFIKTYQAGKVVVGKDYENKLRWLKYFRKCAQDLEDKIDGDILDKLGDTSPRFDIEEDAYSELSKLIKRGMKRRVNAMRFKRQLSPLQRGRWTRGWMWTASTDRSGNWQKPSTVSVRDSAKR